MFSLLFILTYLPLHHKGDPKIKYFLDAFNEEEGKATIITKLFADSISTLRLQLINIVHCLYKTLLRTETKIK